MSTLNPHPIAGDFNEALYRFLEPVESFVPRIYSDSRGVPTLGVGYALAILNQQTGLWGLRSDLSAQLASIGVTLINSDLAILNASVQALNRVPGVVNPVPTYTPGENSANPINNLFSFLLTGTDTSNPLFTQAGEAQFYPLFSVVVDEFKVILRARIGNEVFSALAGSNEMVALLSLTFNSPSLIGSKLIAALQTGNRAEAWYEIRYDSNKERSTTPSLVRGIADRRYSESDTFGLYENAPLTSDEAKSVFRMYTAHRDVIQNYESDPRTVPGATDTFAYESQAARNLLVTTFAQGRPIDGEVLVGRDNLFSSAQFPERLSGTATGDLILGEAGRDRIEGLAGQDVLYGGLGDDTLTGGAGDDYLDGGFDNDTYYWNTGDGNDRIEDALGRNLIVADQRILVGGIRQTGDPADTYRSLDGTSTYELSGIDLLVHIGSATLTVNENFQSGQFGIRLIDATEADYNNGLPTTTVTGTAGDDTIVTGGVAGTINAVVNAGAGDDTVLASANHDQLFGEAGLDTLFGNSGDDRLYGGTENDFLHGDNDDASVIDGDDSLEGHEGNDELVGGWGDDLLLGGVPLCERMAA